MTNQSKTGKPYDEAVGAVTLRPVTDSDLPLLYEYQRDPEANAMAAFPARDLEAFMSHWHRILRDPNVLALTVLVDHCVAGNVGCWNDEGRWLIGYWIGRKYWGKGVATKMLSKLLDLTSDRPLYAVVAKHNGASIRVLEKCGFEYCAASTGSLIDSPEGIEELVYVKVAH